MRITVRAAGNSQLELHLQSRPLLSLAHPRKAFGSSVVRAKEKKGGRFYWNAVISSLGNRLANDFGAKGFFYTPRMN
jgi:hypothetical protein